MVLHDDISAFDAVRKCRLKPESVQNVRKRVARARERVRDLEAFREEQLKMRVPSERVASGRAAVAAEAKARAKIRLTAHQTDDIALETLALKRATVDAYKAATLEYQESLSGPGAPHPPTRPRAQIPNKISKTI